MCDLQYNTTACFSRTTSKDLNVFILSRVQIHRVMIFHHATTKKLRPSPCCNFNFSITSCQHFDDLSPCLVVWLNNFEKKKPYDPLTAFVRFLLEFTQMKFLKNGIQLNSLKMLTVKPHKSIVSLWNWFIKIIFYLPYMIRICSVWPELGRCTLRDAVLLF